MERPFVRYEHQNKIYRVSAGFAVVYGIVFLFQLFDMASDAEDMTVESCLTAGFIFGIHIVRIGSQTDFAVDDDIFVVRIMDDDIRTHGMFAFACDDFAAFIAERFLTFIVNTAEQAGALQNIFKDQFAPVALCFLLAFECVDQTACLAADAVGFFHHFVQLSGEGGVEFDAFVFGIFHGIFEFAHFFFERI